MGLKIGEFFVALGIDTKKQDSATLNDFLKGLLNLDLRAVAATGGLVLVGKYLRNITTQAVKAGQSLYSFQTQTGLSSNQLQKWSYFAEQMGSSAEDVESSVKALSMATQQILLGQGNIAPFQFLGIDPRQDPFKILDDLRKRLKTLDPEMARFWVTQLGLSESMINVLKSTDEEWASINAQFAITADHVEDLREINVEWVKLKQTIHAANMTLASFLAQDIKGFLRTTREAINEMGDAGKKIFGGDSKKDLNHWVSSIKSVFGFVKDALLKNAVINMQSGGLLLPGLFDMQRSQPQVIQKTDEYHITIPIDGARDPRAVALEVAGEFGKIISDTSYQIPKDNR